MGAIFGALRWFVMAALFVAAGMLAVLIDGSGFLDALAITGSSGTASTLTLAGAPLASWCFFAAACTIAVPPLRFLALIGVGMVNFCIPRRWTAARLYVVTARGPVWRVAWTVLFPFLWSAIVGEPIFPNIRLRITLVLAAAAILEGAISVSLRAYRQAAHLAAFQSKVDALQTRLRAFQALTLLASSVAAARRRFHLLFPGRAATLAAAMAKGDGKLPSGPGAAGMASRFGLRAPHPLSPVKEGSAVAPAGVGEAVGLDLGASADGEVFTQLHGAAGGRTDHTAARPLPVSTGRGSAGLRLLEMPRSLADMVVAPPTNAPASFNGELIGGTSSGILGQTSSAFGGRPSHRDTPARSHSFTGGRRGMDLAAGRSSQAEDGPTFLRTAPFGAHGDHGSGHSGPHHASSTGRRASEADIESSKGRGSSGREWTFVPSAAELRWSSASLAAVAEAIVFAGPKGAARRAEMRDRWGWMDMAARADKEAVANPTALDDLVMGLASTSDGDDSSVSSSEGSGGNSDDDGVARGRAAVSDATMLAAARAAAADLGVHLPASADAADKTGSGNAAATAAAAAASGGDAANGGVGSGPSLAAMLGLRRGGKGGAGSVASGAIPLFAVKGVAPATASKSATPVRGVGVSGGSAALPQPTLVGALSTRAARKVMFEAFSHLDYKRSGRVTVEMMASRLGVPAHAAAEIFHQVASVPTEALSKRDFAAAGAKLVHDLRALGRTVEDFGAVATAVRLAALGVWAVVVLFVGLWAFQVSLLDVVVPFGLMFTSLGFAAGEPAKVFFNGLFVLTAYAPFEVGDRVSINGMRVMTVTKIGVVSTWYRTVSGREMMLSNHTLLLANVENYSRCKAANVEILFTIGFRTTPRQFDAFVETVVAYANGLPTRWEEDSVDVMIKDGSGVDSKLNFVIWLTHRRGWNESLEVLTDASRATMFFIQAMQRLGIEYVSSAQPVMLKVEDAKLRQAAAMVAAAAHGGHAGARLHAADDSFVAAAEAAEGAAEKSGRAGSAGRERRASLTRAGGSRAIGARRGSFGALSGSGADAGAASAALAGAFSATPGPMTPPAAESKSLGRRADSGRITATKTSRGHAHAASGGSDGLLGEGLRRTGSEGRSLAALKRQEPLHKRSSRVAGLGGAPHRSTRHANDGAASQGTVAGNPNMVNEWDFGGSLYRPEPIDLAAWARRGTGGGHSPCGDTRTVDEARVKGFDPKDFAASFEPPRLGAVGKLAASGTYDERLAANRLRKRNAMAAAAAAHGVHGKR
ncbi:hypothetical protein FNF29_02742 [Cafeteria roenbergensis]|uniref:Mechanosensitive ion channel MscS domain-containing protein n=2 Tax=Cafeteria roenbergensis TaxID=33653 RepID=A0A5A8CQP0_CAFRO|nr:hypothetical protein FNF29_02742 [Cafeteria roenbergensis]|eukprot:KAA0154121.1 hypothetical protein FNF29_02742 [Cafeteria roenbergensis]